MTTKKQILVNIKSTASIKTKANTEYLTKSNEKKQSYKSSADMGKVQKTLCSGFSKMPLFIGDCKQNSGMKEGKTKIVNEEKMDIDTKTFQEVCFFFCTCDFS